METKDNGISVLLVDSHPTFLWGLEKFINLQHPRLHVVGQVTRWADVLDAVASTSPDIVLMEVELGGKSAIELLPQLTETAQTKVVILSGVRDSAVRERAFMSGARGFVGKWEAPDVIVKAIEHVHRGEVWMDRQMMAKMMDKLSWSTHRKKKPATAYEALTTRELDIVAGIVRHRGAPNKVIADELNISPNTLRNHLAAVYEKLGIHRRFDLLMYFAEHGFENQRM